MSFNKKIKMELCGPCVCCLHDGCFKAIWNSYTWMGEEEIYGSMLEQCFAVDLQGIEEIRDGFICESCITRLRDAYKFKNQALDSIVRLQNGSGPREDSGSVRSESDEYYEVEFLEDDFDEVEVKEERIERPPQKKDNTPGKPSGKRNKHLGDFVEEVEIKKISNKPRLYSISASAGSDSIKNEYLALYNTERNAANHQIFVDEIKNILLHTNAVPFKTVTQYYHCAYCKTRFDDPEELRPHVNDTHITERINAVSEITKPSSINETFKLDIKDLQCTVCNVEVTWPNLFQHLEDVHQTVFTKAKQRIIPFILRKEGGACCLCEETFPNYGALDKHMNTHLQNFVCPDCGLPFLSYKRFSKHALKHVTGEYPCHICGKVFPIEEYKKKHFDTVHMKLTTAQCKHCPEKFASYYARHVHSIEKHPSTIKYINCELCDKVFDWKPHYLAHKRKDHLKERNYECTLCDLQFFSLNDYKRHLLMHTGVKEHQCDVCKKMFVTKQVLKAHINKVHTAADCSLLVHTRKKRPPLQPRKSKRLETKN